MSSAVSTTTVVGLKVHDFLKDPWNANKIREAFPLHKQLVIAITKSSSGDLSYILDEISHPDPTISALLGAFSQATRRTTEYACNQCLSSPTTVGLDLDANTWGFC